jgi:uncharacterized membrane protein
MIAWTSAAPSVLASFMASMVEFVEALTIVLAVGVVRGWRSALLGTGAAVALLLALVVLLGSSLTRIPLPVIQVVVGTLLLMFGLRWLRKAVLRSAGVLALHDEAKTFAQESESMRLQGRDPSRAFDTVAFIATFKSVALEGIEVVFIVIAVGASGRMLLPAAAGALLALLVVVLLGLWLHRPLASVPENTLKFGVGVMLSGFGTFWVGEGIGLRWPGEDWTLLALIGAFLLVAIALVRLCSRERRAASARARVETAAASPEAKPGALAELGQELLGLFVDDGWLAAGIVLWVPAIWFASAHLGLPQAASGALLALGLATILSSSAA